MPEEIIEISGIEEVCDWLSHAPKAVAEAGLISGLHAAGEIIEAAIDVKTPVRTERKGGDKDYPSLITGLRMDLTVDSQGRGGSAEIGFRGHQAQVADWVEFGHKQVAPSQTERYVNARGKSKKGKLIGDVPPHPFMRPGFDESADAAVSAFVENVDAAVKQFQES